MGDFGEWKGRGVDGGGGGGLLGWWSGGVAIAWGDEGGGWEGVLGVGVGLG